MCVLHCGANHLVLTRRPRRERAGPSAEGAEPRRRWYLLIIITASSTAAEKRDRPSARRGRLMMTPGDLQLLASCCRRSHAGTLERHLLPQTFICTFRHFCIFLLAPPVISAFRGAIFVFLTRKYSSQTRRGSFPPPTAEKPEPTGAWRPRCCLCCRLRVHVHAPALVLCAQAVVCVGEMSLGAANVKPPFSPFVSAGRQTSALSNGTSGDSGTCNHPRSPSIYAHVHLRSLKTGL